MTDRDKLVELIDTFNRDFYKYVGDRKLIMFDDHVELADHLIANGVTVNEWRPASEPPKESGEYLVIQTGFGRTWQKVCKYSTNLRKVDRYYFPHRRPGWYGYDGEWGYYEVDDITHWMPLPTPPKGVDNG